MGLGLLLSAAVATSTVRGVAAQEPPPSGDVLSVISVPTGLDVFVAPIHELPEPRALLRRERLRGRTPLSLADLPSGMYGVAVVQRQPQATTLLVDGADLFYEWTEAGQHCAAKCYSVLKRHGRPAWKAAVFAPAEVAASDLLAQYPPEAQFAADERETGVAGEMLRRAGKVVMDRGRWVIEFSPEGRITYDYTREQYAPADPVLEDPAHDGERRRLESYREAALRLREAGTSLGIPAADDGVWVSSAPVGAEVYLTPTTAEGGVDRLVDPRNLRGKTPLYLRELAPGEYDVAVALPLAELIDLRDDDPSPLGRVKIVYYEGHPSPTVTGCRALRLARLKKTPGQLLLHRALFQEGELFPQQGARELCPADTTSPLELLLLYPLGENFRLTVEAPEALTAGGVPPEERELVEALLTRGGKALADDGRLVVEVRGDGSIDVTRLPWEDEEVAVSTRFCATDGSDAVRDPEALVDVRSTHFNPERPPKTRGEAGGGPPTASSPYATALGCLRRGDYTEALPLLQQVLAQLGDSEQASAVHVDIAEAQYELLAFPAALEHLETACQQVGDLEAARSGWLARMADAAVMLGDYEGALRHLDQALWWDESEAAQDLQVAWGKRNLLVNLNLLADRALYERALGDANYPEYRVRQLLDGGARANWRRAQGLIYTHLRDWRRAATALRAAAETHHEQFDRLSEASDLSVLAGVLWAEGERDEALAVLETARRLHQAVRLDQEDPRTDAGDAWAACRRPDSRSYDPRAEGGLVFQAAELWPSGGDILPTQPAPQPDVDAIAAEYVHVRPVAMRQAPLPAHGSVPRVTGDPLLRQVNRYRSGSVIFVHVRECSPWQGEADVLSQLGELCREGGNPKGAWEVLVQARRLHQAIGDGVGAADDLTQLGETHLALGEPDRAGETFAEARQWYAQYHIPSGLWRAEWGAGQVAEAKGDLPGALHAYLWSTEAIQRIRRRAGSLEQRAGFLEDKLAVYDAALRVLWEELRANQPLDEKVASRGATYAEVALSLLEEARGRAFLDSLEERRLLAGPGRSPEIDQLRTEEDRLQMRLVQVNQQRVREGSGSETSDRTAAEALARELETLERQHDDLRARLRLADLGLADILPPRSASAAELRAELDDRTALVAYALGAARPFAWVLTSEGCEWLQLPTTTEKLQAEATDFADLLRAGGDFAPDVLAARGHALYQELFAPLRGAVGQRDRIVIIPDRSLNRLPFETLAVDPPEADRPKARGSRPHYLLDDYLVSYAPSGSAWYYLRQRSRTRPGAAERTLVAFGDPAYGPSEPSGKAPPHPPEAGELRGMLRERYAIAGYRLRRLPYTRGEVRAVARTFGTRAKCFLGAEATETCAKTEMASHCIIHLAAHGLVDRAYPMYSAIALAPERDSEEDGYLQAWEIMELRLDAGLVVLSACGTASGKEYSGEGVISLAGAFLNAGADSVVASLWPVEDEAAARLMSAFYKAYEASDDKAAALRAAKQGLLDGAAGGQGAAHPYYWAPFILVGGQQ